LSILALLFNVLPSVIHWQQITSWTWLWAWRPVNHNHCWKQHWYFCLSLPLFFCVSVFCFYEHYVWFRRKNEWIWTEMAVVTKQVNL